jgi:solute carrier family 44 (choline transporter-like protein), member 2/4/5
VNKGTDKYYMSDELFAYIDGPAKKNAFKVFQPSRDVSARERTTSRDNVHTPPTTNPPIYHKPTAMTKH